ncbi:LysR family transcriptional regulator [Variovorax sp. Sphag1AA]|uniref:LysR family transcriptional regulator n=1 Tax=Variovorax sp. Sphag1AA TaxID=2587027 RepID=UPI001622431B|nr:LysR family transcriptional regulator [Variovorax sp. Sphag1AA]MBB3175638.1 DNA-binding transcriptional LysR family regulator [Variovorax sp. Sphag1AA]
MQRGADLLDGHLLRVLATLVEERSVSRAAARLRQTQPAVSGSLKRLREIFGDALLVRDGTTMVPTARAAGLAVQARRALGEIEALLVEPETFVAANAEQRFRIASPDYIAPSWIARLAQHVSLEAPRCRIELRALGPTFDFERALADDELDLVIGNWPSPPEHLHISLLLEDELVCVMARDHPLAQEGATQVDEADYLAAGHVVPVPYAMGQRGVVETYLGERRLARDARMQVPYFGLAPSIAASTELIFTTARHFAEYHAGLLPLAVLQAPEGFPRMRFYQLWHDRVHHSAAHRWLRALVAQLGRKLAEPR